MYLPLEVYKFVLILLEGEKAREVERLNSRHESNLQVADIPSQCIMFEQAENVCMRGGIGGLDISCMHDPYNLQWCVCVYACVHACDYSTTYFMHTYIQAL